MPAKQTVPTLELLVEDIKATAGDLEEMAQRLINQFEPLRETYIIALDEAKLRIIATALQNMATLERNLRLTKLSQMQTDAIEALRINRHILWETIDIPEHIATGDSNGY